MAQFVCQWNITVRLWATANWKMAICDDAAAPRNDARLLYCWWDAGFWSFESLMRGYRVLIERLIFLYFDFAVVAWARKLSVFGDSWIPCRIFEVIDLFLKGSIRFIYMYIQILTNNTWCEELENTKGKYYCALRNIKHQHRYYAGETNLSENYL